MTELLNTYVDASFIDAIVAMAPAVGVGLLLGIIVAVVGWLWGFVVRISKVDF